MPTIADIEKLFTHVEIGALRAYSKYGIEYELFSLREDTNSNLDTAEAKLWQHLHDRLKWQLERAPEQTKLVWRTKPDVTYDDGATYDDGGTRIKMWARYHLIDPRLKARKNR